MLALCIGAPSLLYGGARAQAPDTSDAPELRVALLGEGGNHRLFRQFEPTTGEVRTYSARVYGGVRAAVGYQQPLVQQLSLTVDADYFLSLAFTSGARRLGKPVGTTAQRMNAVVALSLRLLHSLQAPSLALRAGAGAMRFAFDMPSPQSADDKEAELVNGDYGFIRAGLGLGFPLGVLRFGVTGDYLHGFFAGDFGTREPAKSPTGFDAATSLDYHLLPWLDLALRGNLTLLLLRLAPLPQRPTDAQAEVRDLYLAFAAGACARF